MRRLLAVLAALLLSAMPVRAGGTTATIAVESIGGGEVTYAVTVARIRNPYGFVWVGQRCYLDGQSVDVQHQAVRWTTVTETKGNRFDAVGVAGPFQTSGIHHGSDGDTPWISDQCEAWVWLYPDLDPIATTGPFSV